MNDLNRYGTFVGRLLIAFIFVASGVMKITGFNTTVGYIASKSLPLPTLSATSAIVVELGGDCWLCSGYKARWAAA